MKQYCMIETAFSNKDEAIKTVETLLEEKLVVSCQMIESQSKWRWNGELEECKEYLILMKTKKTLAKDIQMRIREIHSYDCFEMAIFDLDSCDEEYLNWIKEETITKERK